MKNKREKETKVINVSPFPGMEEEVLKFWEKAKIFEKSVERDAPKGDYVFYDGPPFATGMPHYGHLVSGVMKDVVPRYFTMSGYKVERKWGWDCHGLPIENIVEKEMGSKSKKDIERLGVAEFNEKCRSKVLDYVSDWEQIIKRFGRWADMKNAYKTMDLPFMESVWWVFKELWDRDLIYEGYRSMHICPRCETTLSQQEVSEGYKDIKDLSLIAKFELADELETFVLAWTTTPWTLIGNVALAVGKKIKYVLIENNQGEKYILAKERLEVIQGEYKILKEFAGIDLIGKTYKPLFDYYAKDEKLENLENGWKIYHGDFVTTGDGTGVVHIAPAFGEDDMNLGKEKNLPFVQHVNMDGTIRPEAEDFAGMHVKAIDDHTKTDVEIIKYLAHKGLLFAKEKYEHSYPHCWRCDTPLINYATTSWFVNVLKVKERALELAKGINWSPAHIKEGRFGNWLDGARDWSISRQRFWASVMPIWKCACGEMKVIGSVDELKKNSNQKITKILFVRHGESEKNIKNILSDSANKWPLTEKGRRGIEAIKETIKDQVDIIITSPILRAKESAEILNKKFKTEIIENNLLKEIAYGEWNNKTVAERQQANPSLYAEYQEINKDPKKRFNYKLGRTGESRQEVFERTVKFLDGISKKYAGKTILVVGHGVTYGALIKYFEKLSEKDYFGRSLEDPGHDLVNVFYIDREAKAFDLHKDKLDSITFKCEKCSGVMKRVPDVLDTWFDSGSMPYAQMHYPFENKEKFEKNFPAQFIAEGVDQTRAWFYYLHVIGTAIKNKPAFKNVIVNGIVLAEDGKKMSKRLNNYPDPAVLFDRYGADSMRLYLLSSAVTAAENLNFAEDGVKEVLRNNPMTLWNVYKFYELFATESSVSKNIPSENVLDKWILSRLNQLIEEATKQMNAYDLPRSVRPITEFVNDLSTWYLRRSRDRFKSDDEKDKKAALATTKHVLIELAKIMAPFMPFLAEQIWQKVMGNDFKDENKSVHLEKWPSAEKIDEKILRDMETVRRVVELGLAKRDEAGIKVRQPLASLKVKSLKSKVQNEFLDLIKDEMNVKKIIQEEGDGELAVELDLKITPELKLEGVKREIVRFVNNMRKDAGMSLADRAEIFYDTDLEKSIVKDALDKFAGEILNDTLSEAIRAGVESAEWKKEVKIEGEAIKLGISLIK